MQTSEHHQTCLGAGESHAQTGENRCPVAFDISFRSPFLEGWHVASHAKIRLEKYGERKPTKTKQALEEAYHLKCQKAEQELMYRKEKAFQHNKHVTERMLHIQNQHFTKRMSKSACFTKRFTQKCQKAEQGLIDRKEKARKHNEKVAEIVLRRQRQQVKTATKKMLAELVDRILKRNSEKVAESVLRRQRQQVKTATKKMLAELFDRILKRDFESVSISKEASSADLSKQSAETSRTTCHPRIEATCKELQSQMHHHVQGIPVREKQSSVAFVISLRSPAPAGWHFASLAKERLEKYGERNLPRTKEVLEDHLLQKSLNATAWLIQRKGMAHEHNKKVEERVQIVHHRRMTQAETKKMFVERFTLKCQKAQQRVIDRKEKARQHNDKVTRRAETNKKKIMEEVCSQFVTRAIEVATAKLQVGTGSAALALLSLRLLQRHSSKVASATCPPQLKVASEAQHFEKPSPVSFEIPFRRPTRAGEHIASVAKERLEKYGECKCLKTKETEEDGLRQKSRSVQTCWLIERKGRAHHHNRKVVQRVQNVQHRRFVQAENKKILMQTFTQKCQKAEQRLIDRKEKARQYNQKITANAVAKNIAAQLCHHVIAEAIEKIETGTWSVETFFEGESSAAYHADLKVASEAQHSEIARSVSFDISFRTAPPAGWHVASLAKERLEKYCERKSPKTKEMLEDSQLQAQLRAAMRSTVRRDKAHQYNEEVAQRVQDLQLISQFTQTGTKKMLEETFSQKLQKAEARLTERRETARKHNLKVAERARLAQQQWEERVQAIKTKWEQKQGSRVKGEFFSHVMRERSKIYAAVANATCVGEVLEDIAPSPTGNGCLGFCDSPINLVAELTRHLLCLDGHLPPRRRNLKSPQRLNEANLNMDKQRDMKTQTKIEKPTTCKSEPVVGALPTLA